MRSVLIAAAFTLATSGLASAGGAPEKQVPVVVVCGDCGAPSSSGNGLIVPLLLLLVLGAAAAN